MLHLHKASIDISLEEFVEFVLGDVAAIVFIYTLTNILSSQDLISVCIVPGSLLRVRQTLIGFLNCLKNFGRVLLAILVWMPLKCSFFVSLEK